MHFEDPSRMLHVILQAVDWALVWVIHASFVTVYLHLAHNTFCTSEVNIYQYICSLSKVLILNCFLNNIKGPDYSQWIKGVLLLYFSNATNILKTQHQNPEFGHKPDEIKKNLQNNTLAFNRGETQKTIRFCGKLSFILASPPLSFFLSASTAATCIFTAPICTATIITLEPSALNVQHFIPRFNKIFLICRYHWKRGWGVKGDQKTGWLCKLYYLT